MFHFNLLHSLLRSHFQFNFLLLLPCLLLLCLVFTGPLIAATQISDSISPEAETGRTNKEALLAKQHLVVTANPYASKAAFAILKQGGSAIDAMITAQLVLGLVEPQSSGIGGGAFLLYFDNKNQALLSFDGRETAPAAASENLFLTAKQSPMGFFDAVVGGRSVGVPGVIALMWQSHQQYGKLPWKTLFTPAIELAQQGFIVSPRLAQLVTLDQNKLGQQPSTRDYFFDLKGEPIKAGATLQNLAYADSLSIIAKLGKKGFYQGRLAKAMVNAVQQHPTNPGLLSLEDLGNYQVKTRPNICLPYQQIYQVCGMGLPSSGALTVNQILALTEQAGLSQLTADNPQAWRLIGDASRLAFADRARYMADPDFTPDYSHALLDKTYLSKRAKLLGRNIALSDVQAGELSLAPDTVTQLASQTSEALPSTTHLAIHDRDGNIVSMTSSIENAFGARLMVGGFLLNNQLTDFSFQSHYQGQVIANRVMANKRPRSSMSPTLVFKHNKPYMALGSPGGSRIINYVSQVLIAHLTWQVPLQQAIEMPHLVNQSGVYLLEQDTPATQWQSALEKLGYKTQVKPLNSGLHGFVITEHGLESGVDPRREGLAVGE
ncbi:gamma-glutamyltransferase [Motilimonas eburnea]|uniref:gamma-glutamyltransferase n=1 Tax=Motilimonas eburnea TaxID=1737488 RepID=UPI001E4201CD|nr:gamma-glutamyltransferase [Motilimonas eburnea]MCE2570069.1 gamma-glutamyltransferase [Motilimonas eburnea]